MTLIQLVNTTKNYGGKAVLSDINLQINPKEKLALIGPNGSGKTTLLNIISGEIQPDSGSRSISGKVNISYVAQLLRGFDEMRVEDFAVLQHPTLGIVKSELIELEGLMNKGQEVDYNKYMKLLDDFDTKGGYLLGPQVGEIIEKMGLNYNPDQHINQLSQGEKKIVQIGSAISAEPDVLILDEPTNHIDASASEIIDSIILNFKGALIYSTHDRYLLNRVANRILDLGDQVREFNGTYDEFVDHKLNSFEAEMRKYKSEQKKKSQLRETMLKMKSIGSSGYDKPAKVAKNLERRIDTFSMKKPKELKKSINVGFSSEERGGNIVLKTRDLEVGYKDKVLLENVDITIQSGDKIGVLGINGSGKTALLNHLLGYDKSTKGDTYIGPSIRVAYLSQNNIDLDESKTVEDFLIDAGTQGRTSMHGLMKSWQFDDSDIEKKIEYLSGGERKKLLLMKIMLQKPNFIILDEPTDHLDMISREGLERSLSNYEGTLLMVSHDRYFLDAITNKTALISGNKLFSFEGSYSENLRNIERHTNNK